MRNRSAVITFLLALASAHCGLPEGFVVNKSIGIGYRLMYRSLSWPEARESCEREGTRMAVPKTAEEFSFIQKLVRGMHYPSVVDSDYKLLVWVGITNIEDYRVWKNIDGEDIEKTPFHKWSGENGQGYSDNPEEPHCGGLDAVNPGFRDFWCHRRQPYVCQINLNE